jgi:hypothetical protein
MRTTVTMTYHGQKYCFAKRTQSEGISSISIKPKPEPGLWMRIIDAANRLKARWTAYSDRRFLRACGVLPDLAPR